VLASIRARLTLSHLAVIVVAMLLSGFVLLSLIENYFLQAMEENLLAQAQITAQTLIPGGSAEGPDPELPTAAYNTLQQQSSNLSLRAENVSPPAKEAQGGWEDLSYLADASLELSSPLDTRILILDGSGVVLADSQQELQGSVMSADPLVAQALAGQYATQTEGSGRDSAMVLAMPLLVEGQPAGAIHLSQSLRDVVSVIRDLRLRWLQSTLVAVLLAAAVGLLLSGAITQPLRRLTAAAGNVARGQFDEQVPVRSRDELGRLSQAFNDMTSRLRAAHQTQTDFVANVSHELRTPLTAIKGIVETLREGAVDDSEVRDPFLATVEAETDRLIRLVNDLLILTRADSDALSLGLEPTDAVQLAESVVHRLAHQAEARGVALEVVAPPDCPLVLADDDRLEQVLLNLLDNAIKYSEAGGTVTVAMQDAGDGRLEVHVRDEGIGIAAEHLPRVGERFYRADRARSRADGGSGLGLAIAQALIRAQGGRVRVESQEGQGTVVSFNLPAA
jgi:signal transduction histidine kinase